MSKQRQAFSHAIDYTRGRVEMVHGSGGKASSQLVEDLFLAAFDNPWLKQQSDQAILNAPPGRLVMATDSHVISPLFFAGGDIGSLAVHGTVNDVAMSGATPLYLSAGFILEEGFPLVDLQRIVQSMAAAAVDAGVTIVTGDTKVVEKGKGDGVFINTTGVGVLPDSLNLSAERIQPGDKILLSGTIGDHGVAIMSQREGLNFEVDLLSDSASLNGLVAAMVEAVPELHYMRDPTRGGVAAILNELARQTRHGMVLQEASIPVLPPVASACEFLGLDPLNVANEGKLLAFCPAGKADTLLAAMKKHRLGQQAAIIGEVVEDEHHFVQMKTRFGGSRVVDWLNGEQLPRIC